MANKSPLATMAGEPLAIGGNDTNSDKPTFIPSYWERKYGKIIKGIFHKPDFVVCRNGKYIEVAGGGVSTYSYDQAFHIMLHLQAISNDNFTIDVVSWQPMTNYNVIMESNA